MIYVHWFTLVIYVVVIIMVMVRVLMDNRQPAKTMAWMLVLTFIRSGPCWSSLNRNGFICQMRTARSSISS